MLDPAGNSLPPQNVEAEESILGGILLDPEAMNRIADFLNPEAFYISIHAEIYKAALALHWEEKPTDLMTVTSWLQDRGKLDDIGGTGKLAQLVERTVSAVNIDRYADLVMDKFTRRQLIGASHEITELGYDGSLKTEEILDRAEQKIFAISQQQQRGITERNETIAIRAYENLETSSIEPTGFYDLDELIGGYSPGEMILLAGRPSMGKSAIALCLAANLLTRGIPVAYFSLEMSKEQLEYRLWSLISAMNSEVESLPSDRIRKHRLGSRPFRDEDWANLSDIVAIAAEFPLYINDDRSISHNGIASECRKIKAREELGLVIVDYIQLMAESTTGNRSYELGDVARGLYKMAGNLEVPLLCLSQISRGVEERKNKRPLMSDLSQSGILEMVADAIVFAYRDEYYDPSSPDNGILELIAGKSRHGTTGTARVLFDPAFGLLTNFQDVKNIS